MKKLVAILVLVSAGIISHAQKSIDMYSYMQQNGLYYSSDNLTISGFGFGAGFGISFKKNILAQADLNIYWINGNAYSARFSAGYKKNGLWSPAIYLTTSILWGSGTEILLDDGSRPSNMINSIGLRLAALRFENEKGYVSALEFGYGFGQYQGKSMELSVLAIGIKF